MINDILVLGFAVFAAAHAISRTEIFARIRGWARKAYAWPAPLFYLSTPLRATLCPTCISFWIAAPAPWLPVAAELDGAARVLLWLAPVGVSALLAHVTEPDEPPLMMAFPDLDDVGPHPGDEPSGAEIQTADEVP